MTDQKKPREHKDAEAEARNDAEAAARQDAPQDAEAAAPAADPAGEAAARENGGPDGGPHGGPEAEIARLEGEKAELRDQLLRALADVENTRRRLQRELDEKLKYATAPLAKDLLGVADNLGRALTAVPAEVREQEAVESLISGVEMTEKALLEAFAKHGIERIDPAGQKLDPHRHEAMMEIQDPSKPAGTVAQVFEAGYELKGRLLRPARVAVAKGGPMGNGSGGNGRGGNGPGGEPAEPGSTVDTKA